MIKFKNGLKKRFQFILGLNGLAVAFISLAGIYSNRIASGNINIAAMIHGFQLGIFIGIEIIMIRHIVKYRKALESEEELKKLYIEEHDERRKFIKDKIGGVGFNLVLVVIATATVSSGFFNQLVFLVLLGVLVFMALVKGSLKIYYRNKF